MLNDLDQAMTAIVLGKSEAAMIPLWRIHMALRQLDIREPMKDMDEVNASIRDSIRKIAGTDDRYQAKLERDRARKAREREMVRAAKQGKLPPMRRLRKIQVREVPCPRCGAKAGQPCTGFTSPVNGTPTGKAIKTFHQARQDKAAVSNRRHDKSVAVEAFGVSDATAS